MNQTIFNSILHKTSHNSPECEAAAYIDLRSTVRLGEYFYPSLQQPNDDEMMNLMTLAVIDLFNGKHILALADYFKYHENINPDEEYFQKLTLKGADHTQVYVRLNFNPNHVLAFLFSNHIGRGMMLTEVKKFAKKIQDIAEKTPLDPPILPTDEHTIDGATPSPLPQPSIVLNTPTNPEVQPETNTDKPNNQGDIVSMLDRWLKS